MLKVYTSRVFKYSGPNKLDITAKGGSEFAPTWDMVWGIKRKQMSEEEYENRYRKMIRREQLERLLKRKVVVLCCYCRPEEFCHRFLLAEMLQELGAQYRGEI